MCVAVSLQLSVASQSPLPPLLMGASDRFALLEKGCFCSCPPSRRGDQGGIAQEKGDLCHGRLKGYCVARLGKASARRQRRSEDFALLPTHIRDVKAEAHYTMETKRYE